MLCIKKNRKISIEKGIRIFGTTVILCLLFLYSCNPFTLPEYPRNNPNDPNNPYPPAQNIEAEVVSSPEPDTQAVVLSWEIRESVPGYYIIRKPGSEPPSDEYDGIELDTFSITQDFSTDRYILRDTVPAYSTGSTDPRYYTYRIWTTDGREPHTDSGSVTADLLN